jgi:type VI secretion system secreted protein Hcp
MKDIYVKFTPKTNSKKIPGESLDKDHPKGLWMEVASWSHQVTMPKSATASTAGGHTSERSEHSEMVFTKDIDKSSVYLWEAVSAGYSYDVEIEFFRAMGTMRTKYLAIKLGSAIVSRVATTVPPEGLPIETFAIKYAKVVWNHIMSTTDGNHSAGNDVGGWDLALNKVVAS